MEFPTSKPKACPDANGTLPECAPLAVPYVPFQQSNPKKYSQADALGNGTLFPGLNLPFRVASEARNVPATPLSELQALEFVILELGLYLNTHPDDAEAFSLYQRYVALEQEARKSYVAVHGPLFQSETAMSSRWNWTQDPWPWNVQEGAKK